MLSINDGVLGRRSSFLLRFLVIFIILMILSISITLLFKTIAKQDATLNNIAANTVQEEKRQPIFDNGSIVAYFCQTENCLAKVLELITAANQSISCALYDLDNQEILQTLQQKAQQNVFVRIVADNDNRGNLEGNVFRFDNNNQLMHNKFCIFDNNMLFTGSMNPTHNDIFRNDNNLVVINSSRIAENYNNEFEELWNGEFGKGKKVKYPEVLLNQNQKQMRIENYFCPEDNCEQQVIKTLSGANESIYFMTFSFTANKIGNILLEKAKQGIIIEGVFDTSQKNKFTEYEKLKNANNINISVFYDKNKYKMHHKVFIVDNITMITGSYNPTKNGNENNDENIIIIYNKEIAEQYLMEFERVKSLK